MAGRPSPAPGYAAFKFQVLRDCILIMYLTLKWNICVQDNKDFSALITLSTKLPILFFSGYLHFYIKMIHKTMKNASQSVYLDKLLHFVDM